MRLTASPAEKSRSKARNGVRNRVASVSPALGEDGNVRVLIVEDHRDLADYIADGLRDQGMAADVAYASGRASDAEEPARPRVTPDPRLPLRAMSDLRAFEP